MNIYNLIGTKTVATLPLKQYEFVYGMRENNGFLEVLTSQSRLFILDKEYKIKEIIDEATIPLPTDLGISRKNQIV
jgi:hypothetical protein